ncbi:protein purity of essence [Lucilia cuprina]|uniref:protein purity of essence n=1 Tax=Lucilia cuprina TaxID=7375 RepID=UPI001F05C900|nr:protein purity of essence [Lucilia cuprina]
MSAHSGGSTDWSSVVKPLLNNRYGVLNKNEILNIIKAITRCENELFDEENNYLQFYTAFAALAAEKLSQCKLVSQTQVPHIHEACAILIRFIILRLSKVSVYEIKWLLPALKSLCEGKTNTQTTTNGSNTAANASNANASTTGLSSVAGGGNTLQFDYNIVASVLKSSKYPENTKSIVSASSSAGTGNNSSDKDSPKSEIKRSRSDLSSIIIQQLTAPLEAGKITWAPLSEEQTDCSEMFSASNISYLQSLNGADLILDVCSSLPILARYRLKYQETIANLAGKPLYLPLTQVEATQIKNTLTHMVTDISILSQALTLPILQPLSPSRIAKLSKCAISALYCAVLTSIASSVLNMSSSTGSTKTQQTSSAAAGSTASASTQTSAKDADDNEENARFIVDKALEIYTTIGLMFKNSARSHIYQNHLCFGAWLLVSGIQGALGASGSSNVGLNKDDIKQSKTKTSDNLQATPPTASARVNLFKVQQGFGVLNAAIANHCIKLLTELIEDLKIETTSSLDMPPATGGQATTLPEPANFDVLENYSTLQRVMRVLNTATLHQLFTFLATVTYRKACNLKRSNAKDRTECEPISYSDSTTYFNDTLSCSDNSEEDDSESYLGHWFKETLQPESNEDNNSAEASERNNEAQKSNLVPALDEPHEYLDLAAQIFSFMDQFFSQKHSYLQRYVKAGLSDQQMLLMANILKDLDRDSARGETEAAPCNKWQSAMIRFSGAVGRYLHNLISASLLSESLQSNLLQHLGVSPWSSDTNTWPLQVYPSTLSVLVQILLLKPTQEKEAACLSVWHRLINTLVEGVCGTSSTNPPTNVDYEDLNMEHAQLLLFLYHSLNLMQKKSILLLTAGGVIRCAEVCRDLSAEKPIRNSQMMLLSRLLLFLEYLMKHLYNAPPELLDQVRWNLFSISTMHENQKISDLLNNKTKLTSFCRKDIEDEFRKNCMSNIRPTFYYLTIVNDSGSSSAVQDFKLDGLAWNFILCTPDKLKYPLLVDALIDILSITDMTLSWHSRDSTHTLCAIRYCFGICSKLLLGLPPSTTHVEQLQLDKVPNLHSLIWSIRCPTSHYLIVNSLIKQGMYTQFAETLWNNISDRVSDIRFSLKQTIMGIEACNEHINKTNPPLSYIVLLDALLSHMHAIAWAEKEGIKPRRASASSGATAASPTTSANSPISAGGSANNDESYATTAFDSNEQKGDYGNNSAALHERQQSSKELLQMLVNTFHILRDIIRHKMVQILPLANTTPDNILECILCIVNSKNSYCSELSEQFLKLLDNKNKEVITGDWTEFLPVSESLLSNANNTQQYPVEEYTLSVIEAHIKELTHDNYYSTLNSFKHCLKSLFSLMNLLLNSSQQDAACITFVENLLKPIIIETIMDARMEYVYDISECCWQTLMKGVEQAQDQQQLMSYKYILKYHYRFLMEYAEEMRNPSASTNQSVIFNESLLFAVLKSMTQMLEKPMGVKAIRQFFTQKINEDNTAAKTPSLVDLLLSFTGTNLSMLYAQKLLQFIEKLFQTAQQPDSLFPQEELIQCFAELSNIEQQRIKSWLTHIIYGPQSAQSSSQQLDTQIEKLPTTTGTGAPATTSSTPSSNAQTPTNMATNSAIPSLSEQLGNQSSALDNAEAMDIDDDNATGNATQPAAQQSSLQTVQSLSLWPQPPTPGNSFMATNQSEPMSTQDDQLAQQQQSERNGCLLLNVIKYIVQDGKGGPNGVAMLLFQSLLQLGQSLITPSPQETNDFSDILQIMICLADCAQGKGHSTLFNATIMWLEITKFQVLEKAQTLTCSLIMPSTLLENINALLRYLHELLQSLGYRGSKYQQQPPWDDDIQTDLEDLMDDLANDQQGDEDSFVEDSDEDSLNNKLCTFSLTQKEFMNQHWYHCHTCNMVNTVGVCSVCARVCHKGHDVSYAKYGNFFCDCGAKEDNTCQALRRRLATGLSGLESRQQNEYSSSSGNYNNSSSLSQSKRSQTPPTQSCLTTQQQGHSSNAGFGASNTPGAGSNFLTSTSLTNERISLLSKLLESSKENLQNAEQWTVIVKCILDFFDVLMPAIKENCDLFSIVGCHKRAKAALLRLHMGEQTFQHTDQLMQPTLGSQEGAFENVRMSYSGDQGQTIKQLLSSGLVRRVALCCLSSPHGKRQHLAVSHEKGKVTILQLSALLKQADAAKRKLTLTQLSSAPIPCTVLSLTANPANEDYLAVCGLKECHILTFTTTAATSDHIVLTPQLENGNFIKKALWLPGSQTMLALVTADNVKIYELSEDTYSPKYYFLVAVGKIRDCCFVYQDGVYYMLIIASSGYIYYQKLDDQSLAKHGDFYVTNTLELNHIQIRDVNGQVGGGGVSIYYSHILQMLFFSYSVGRSFVAPLTDVNKGVKSITHLQTSPASKNSSKGPPQPLCQWTEIPGHPGLICAMMHTSNNPVIFMFTPDRIIMQEIKAQSSKSRIMDMVAIRHTVAGVEKTTLILLCEDGSLRIFTAHQESTSFWLSPQVQPLSNQLYTSSLSNRTPCSGNNAKKSKRKSSHQQKTIGPNGNPNFPIDFFEHCTMLQDVDFGGNDLLQIYNKQKLKSRLFSNNGMFVASTKSTGFTLEVYNNDPNMVIVGIRVLLGTQDPHRTPQSVTILGRTIPTPVRRARWFDIPLTREEILQSDKCLKVVFGKSRDPENVSMLDSIEVYGKSKDLVGWPDDTDEVAGGQTTTNATANGTNTTANYGAMGSSTTTYEGYNSITQLDKMVTILLEVLDCSLSLLGQGNSAVLPAAIKQKATKTATSLLLLPTANQVQVQSRYVLATLFGNRQAYHNYKDYEMLVYVYNELQTLKTKLDSRESLRDIDPEAFYRLVLMVRAIATARPQSLTKICLDNKFEIISDLMEFVEKLYEITPEIDEPTSIVRQGLSHTETIVHCLVEIMHAFALADISQVERVTLMFIALLKNESSVISHSAKEAIILRLSPRAKRRKVAIITPPVCSTPTPPALSTTTSVSRPVVASVPSNEDDALDEAAGIVNSAVAAVGGGSSSPPSSVQRSSSSEYVAGAGAAANDPNVMVDPLEAFMGSGFPQLLGLQQDADDEAIMDIAIALSLQQHDAPGGEPGLQHLQQGLSNLQGMRNAAAQLQHAQQQLQGVNAPGGSAAVVGSAGGVGGGIAASSAAGSDDEGSNVATDGSTLRTSPAEPVGSGGSESGGSGVESIGGTSGRSSTYGDGGATASPPRASGVSLASGSSVVKGAVGGSLSSAVIAEMPTTSRAALEASHSNDTEENDATDDEKLAKLHDLRIAILESIISNINTLDDCNGLQAIPLIQVILMLTTDLNGNNERDQKILNDLLTALVDYVEMDSIPTASKMKDKSQKNEVRLALLSLFGVLMGKTKSKQAGTTSPPHQFKDNASFVASTTASIMSNNGAFTFCLVVMESLQQHWKRVSNENANNLPSGVVSAIASGPGNNASTPVVTGSAVTPSQNSLLKPVRYGPKPDLSTLIPHNYLKNYPDIFESYDALLTEISVRLPYQILRLSATHPGTYDWYHDYCENMTYTLCEYMMLNLNALLRRQVRKLLMYICGNKEKFRMFRDGHSLDVHFNYAKNLCNLYSTVNMVLTNQSIPILSYDSLVEFTEHLRTCQEISQIRTGNWQKFCLIHEDVIPVLIEIACYQLDDGVSPIILQLLQAALCNNIQAVKQQQQSETANGLSSTASGSKMRSDRDKSEEIEMSFDSKFDPTHCTTFVHQIFRFVSDTLLNKFVRIFLLETNITSIRWQAHSLIYAIYDYANDRQKEKLISILWNMWPLVPQFGRRTAQFVDILGYLTLSTNTITDRLPEFTEKAVEVLRQQNDLLSKHPNASIYTALEQILQMNGYYLESEPCLVCNNPEVPMANIKLPTIKTDTKFTTCTMIVKLVQCHTISKLLVRIADLKRTKMVRTINIYYNNRTVQAVVELKNKPAMWHKARTVTLQSGQTEVKVDFPLPITACNLMIEYADFYETVTGSSENLQCPRCSAAVPSYPGVCGNCGENVFQCHKCRAINYDEKDPFLCHSCGFCKYAKFDFSIYGRVCCAVDPIESAEDRAKTVQIIHSSLERADRIYRQLLANKQMLELLLQKYAEHGSSDRLMDESLGTIHSTSQVNKIIQFLAQKYCVESRSSFEELSKIVQKVKACRSELVAYDRSQMDQTNLPHTPDKRDNFNINKCYGCALASTEQCLTLLRAMASNYECRLVLYSQGLVEELAQHNLRRGTAQIQDEVRNLLVLLTKNNKNACMNLLELINERVKSALLGSIPLSNIDSAIYHEMELLRVLISQDDFCWEQKLKIVFELFLNTCRCPRGPAYSVIQPCLHIMLKLISPTIPSTKLNRDLSPSALSSINCIEGLSVDFQKWLHNDPQHSFRAWKSRMPANTFKDQTKSYKAFVAAAAQNSLQDENILAAVLQSVQSSEQQMMNNKPPDRQTSQEPPNTPPASAQTAETREARKKQSRKKYLQEKYGQRWRLKVLNDGKPLKPLHLTATWLQPILFNNNSRFRRPLVCTLITVLSRTHDRKREILNLLTSFLKYVGEAGEASTDFLSLYRLLAIDTPWRQYLALKGVLIEISQLLTDEIKKIHRLEETTLSSDLSQGYALRQFVELLALFLENPQIRQVYKTRLLGPVLEGYLSLRKLVVQRTRLIDDAQEKLLEMLEEMTSGTEEETRAFMEILIDTVEKTPMKDIKTPVFIFERLYSIIHPEENDESEFFMTLEKDPQQEDFLQGRMLGNPYPSTEQGLGPLMRDIKNKICTDCELIALLEDDNGMELLVNNKIISLDLPVKDVYKKIWLAEGGERDAMRIVYRMRGLLGDATEEFVETLNNKSQEEVDTEQLYRLANVLADCNGLKVMLDRIGSLQNITRSRELIQVLLKLFLICVKVRRCQEVLCQPELGAINTLLKVLQMCLQSESDSLQSSVTEQLLEIMETILSKAASDTLDSFLQFSLTFGGPEYVTALISCTECSNVRNNSSVLRHLIRVLAALVYGNEVKMALLCFYFKDILDFDKFDAERSAEEEFKLELFCVLTNQIEHNCIGGTLKDYIVGLGIVEKAIDYITRYAPCVKPTLLRTDSDELKEFISRPSLKYILRFLTGLATKHEATQLAISKDIIPIIHRLEQVSSDEHVGSLAENLLEALCTDTATAARVQEVRDFTRAEKKRLAMATREKQLDALGMRTNEKGQVTAKGSILQKIEKLRDETGLTCFICREGYACQPAKVLGIYTFTKRCNVEEFELKSRKTIGYTTVTHFNVVHVDCHTSAIRSARGRDEWERASLQNANTRCNGLLPLWGPDVSEAAFSGCMTRHASYMQESTQRCDISYTNSIHDLKLLLMRFAWERSFHEDAGGGGPQSNMHFVPYLLFYAVYLLLSSRSAARDSKTLLTYLTAAASEKWLESAYEVEGPLYMLTVSLALHSHETWQKHRIAHLKRLIAVAQARHISPSVICKALLSPADRKEKEYSVYKPFLMMWAILDLIYNTLFKSVATPKEEDWSISLFNYIRKNDETMLKHTDSILETFTDDFLPCTSFEEFCDVAGLFGDIENPQSFIEEVLQTLPTSVPASSSSSSSAN